MKKLISSLLIALFAFSLNLSAQSITGTWKTIDDETGKAKSEVAIWKAKDGLYYGKIMKLYEKEKQNNTCTKCAKDDPRYNKKIVGMKIITKLKKTKKNKWENGEILDPNNGKVYSCKMWIENGKLKLRGFIGVSLLGRTQTWIRIK